LVAALLIVRIPMRGPAALGLKTRFTVQEAEAASDGPHGLPSGLVATEKSPDALIDPIVSVWVLVFVTVTLWTLLVVPSV
jgi:hypothetical protein